jgi:hypothetical protein
MTENGMTKHIEITNRCIKRNINRNTVSSMMSNNARHIIRRTGEYIGTITLVAVVGSYLSLSYTVGKKMYEQERHDRTHGWNPITPGNVASVWRDVVFRDTQEYEEHIPLSEKALFTALVPALLVGTAAVDLEARLHPHDKPQRNLEHSE